LNTETISAIKALLLRVRAKITDDTNVLWVPHETPAALRSDIDDDIALLGELTPDTIHSLRFQYTGPSIFHNVAVCNGWGDEFLELAAEFEKLFIALQTGRAPQTPPAQ